MEPCPWSMTVQPRALSCSRNGLSTKNGSSIKAYVTIYYSTADKAWSVPATCDFDCDTDYFKENGACIDRKLVPCRQNKLLPERGVDIEKYVLITYTTAGGWTRAAICDWTCTFPYVRESDMCVRDIIIEPPIDGGMEY